MELEGVTMKAAVLQKGLRGNGAMILEGVGWSEYTAFLRAFAERPGFRLTYDQGTLEIMSPLLEHDDPGRFLGQLVWALTDELRLPIRAGGSTTMRRKLKKKGVEADECFWIASAYRMPGRRRLDLRRDPPPDLAIEVEVTKSCLNRLGIYAALRVPEIWRLKGDVLEFLLLQDSGKYRKATRSRSFPQVAPGDLMRFVSRARLAVDLNEVLRDFRKWVRIWK
jgi:Uma2 family endonuclease